MLDRIFVKTYPAPPVDRREALRYAGYKGEPSENALALFDECLRETENAVSCRVCYMATPVSALPERFFQSALVRRRLCGAEYALVFAATVGLEMDRLVLRYQELSPAKALLLQALGAERIESLCDTFCAEMSAECAKRGYAAGSRFSAGYGDLPLAEQSWFFAALDCPRKIGLTLNESLLMTPTKSVTALVPIGGTGEKTGENCADCQKTDCAFRKG